MYVQTTEIRQTIEIGGNIIIAVLGVRGSRVKLGLMVPDGITVIREELGPIDDRPHNPHKKPEGMLVFTREPGDGILIENGILIKVIGADRGRAKLGAEVPRDLKITKGILPEETREQNYSSKERR